MDEDEQEEALFFEKFKMCLYGKLHLKFENIFNRKYYFLVRLYSIKLKKLENELNVFKKLKLTLFYKFQKKNTFHDI